MKAKVFIPVLLIALFLSGCFVYSFYPLYTEDDLFANDLLLGQWRDSDSVVWKFDFNYKGEKIPENVDSTAYILHIQDDKAGNFSDASFIVHLIQLEGTYFLDFYLEDYFKNDERNLFDLHLLPVHSFAKLDFVDNEAQIRWFNPEWLEELIKQNRIRIHHEDNGELILLTAKPQELQKFVTKYVNSEDAFDDGVDATLKKIR